MKYDKDDPADKLLVFIHIPKTAGMTLNNILERHYDLNTIFNVYGNNTQEPIDKLKNLTEAEKRNIKLIRGHVALGLHNFVSKPATYISMLRHPIDRVISHYYYIKRASDHYLYDLVSSHNMSLKDYVNSGICEELENDQTRLLSGLTRKEINTKTDSEFLAIAKQNLLEKFALVGFTERFDESLILLQEKLGLKKIFYTKRNVAKNCQDKSDISKEIIHAIEKKNQLDLEVYDYAQGIFDDLIQKDSINFNLKLRYFKILNNFYNQCSSSKRRVRQLIH